MNKAAAMPAETLKKFAFTFAVATAGLAVATCIFYQIDFGIFPIGTIISYCIAPVLLNLFILFVSDEQKKTWATHNVGGILLYIFFGAWSVFGAYNVLMFILNSLSMFSYLSMILLFATQITYTLDGLVGLVYYHNFKTAAANGGEPLMH